jgi:diguanylate cyclase (GGDEF)-like protein
MNGLREFVGRAAAWLLGTPAPVPPAIAARLKDGLFSSAPILLGGIVNTTIVAAIASARHPQPAFVGWLLFELALGAVRIVVLIDGRRAIASGRREAQHGLAAVLSCAWAASVGYGTFLCLLSADWVLATVACLSAAAMICGICIRNFGLPRLTATMVMAALVPCAVAGLLTNESIVPFISVQLPVFMLTILSATFALHRMMVSWMRALAELDHSRSLTETILHSSPDITLVLDSNHRVIFCKRPGQTPSEQDPLIGRPWLSMLCEDEYATGEAALARADAGEFVNLATSHIHAPGQRNWYDNIVSRTCDSTGRLIVVSRDITHQKRSEERAIWMAQHDTLTGLPNRALLQEKLDALLAGKAPPAAAMLVVDVDNFKGINDALGHDAGDVLLCTIATRLAEAVGDEDLVARTAGDEFALLVAARRNEDVEAIARRIFASLREPIRHGGRLVECGASIGASLIPRDGRDRSQIMKAADIALYAAKAGGRAQLRIFEPSMMVEVERHQAMIAAARVALQYDAIEPHYQPKVSLRTSRIVGFEALLRWRDPDGALRGPDAVEAAFEDPLLGPQISERMLERVLSDIEAWTTAGVDFGHVAINVTSADFRREDFVDTIVARLAQRGLPPACLQIEVTENVFLGRAANEVEGVLQRLSDFGVRIALDDFGTGYASLSHLNQFPVDLLKIDRSFIRRIGESADADAISAAVINLGRSLGMEVIAEGIETAAQEAHLIKLGCDSGQGFLYSKALPALTVPAAIARQDAENRRRA